MKQINKKIICFFLFLFYNRYILYEGTDNMLDIKDLYEKDYLGKKVEICGWIKNHRKQANICFIYMASSLGCYRLKKKR